MRLDSETVEEINSLDCVQTAYKSPTPDGYKILAIVNDRIDKYTLKSELSTIKTSLYVDIRVNN